MDYSKNYMAAASIADRIREAAKSGNTVKAGGGLAARMAATEQKLSGFDEVLPQYMNFSRDLFAPVAAQREDMVMASAPEGYAAASGSASSSGRSAKLSSPIAADVSDKGVRRILETIKTRESGGNYNAKNPDGSASGSYQFIDSTWKNLSGKYGIGTEYGSAKDAPPEVQDRVAAKYVEEILADNNNDVTKIPVVWYTGNAAGEMSAEALAVNRGLNASKYQSNWLGTYNKISGE